MTPSNPNIRDKPFTAVITANSDPGKGGTRDTTIIRAPDDVQAWSLATNWAGANPLVQDGDHLQLSEGHRGIKGTLLKKVP